MRISVAHGNKICEYRVRHGTEASRTRSIGRRQRWDLVFYPDLAVGRGIHCGRLTPKAVYL